MSTRKVCQVTMPGEPPQFYVFESSGHLVAWLNREIDERATFGASAEFRLFAAGMPDVEPVSPVKATRSTRRRSS